MKNINWLKVEHQIIAGIIAGFCGLSAFILVYYLMGFITEPLKDFIEDSLGGDY